MGLAEWGARRVPGDYFGWVFSKLEIGPPIGTRTWGGRVVEFPRLNGEVRSAVRPPHQEPHLRWTA